MNGSPEIRFVPQIPSDPATTDANKAEYGFEEVHIDEFDGGNLIQWLLHNKGIKPDEIESINGGLEKIDDVHIDAEIYKKKHKLPNGKILESNNLKSYIIWEVKLKDNKILRMKEPFLSQVEYPSTNALKRFALWANVYIATVKLPLLGNAAAAAKIDAFAQGNINFRLFNASQMSDHTVVFVALGDDKAEFQIDITNKVETMARNALLSDNSEPQALDEGVHQPRPPSEIIREKIFKEASLIIVRNNQKRAQNEEMVKFNDLENIEDPANIVQELNTLRVTPQAYVMHLSTKVQELEGEYYLFANFLKKKNPLWKQAGIKEHFTKYFYDQVARIKEAEGHTEKRKLKEKQILAEEINSEIRYLERAKANLNHMIILRERLEKMSKQLEKLKALETHSQNSVELEQKIKHLKGIWEEEIKKYKGEVNIAQPPEIEEILKTQI